MATFPKITQTGRFMNVIPPIVMSAIAHAASIGIFAPTKTTSAQKIWKMRIKAFDGSFLPFKKMSALST